MRAELELKAKTLTEMIDKLERRHYKYAPTCKEELIEYYNYMIQLYSDLDEVYKQLFSLKQEKCGI